MSQPITKSLPIPISAMIFTLNEEVHLPSCISSLAWCDDIIVVDSFSTDRTQAICQGSGVRFFQHAFEGFGNQRNWAIDHTDPRYEWILILDADERVTPDLLEELRIIATSSQPGIGAYRVARRFHMWGHWLRYSSLYPSYVVRLIRKGYVRYINRGHGETQEVTGQVLTLKHDLIDENLKGIDVWFERQNRYSTKDAEYELATQRAPMRWDQLYCHDPLARRAALKRIAVAMPGRPLLYFLYSYFIRRGFMDGRDGFVFCLMRALYQGMVIAKKHDLRNNQDTVR